MIAQPTLPGVRNSDTLTGYRTLPRSRHCVALGRTSSKINRLYQATSHRHACCTIRLQRRTTYEQQAALMIMERPENKKSLVKKVEGLILVVRGHKFILDRDLAILYGVSTGNLNRAVSRNLDRFPNDFMFQLTKQEVADLIFHFGTSRWGGTRKPPRAFTEHGVAMHSQRRRIGFKCK